MRGGDRAVSRIDSALRIADACRRRDDGLQAAGSGVVLDGPASVSIEGLVSDITTRNHAEEGPATDSQRLEAHLDNSPLAVIELDRELRIIRWTAGAERLFGWGAAEALGRGVLDLLWVQGKVGKSAREALADLRGDAPRRTTRTHRNRRKDGSIVHCTWYTSAIYDREGRPTTILSQVIDVTEPAMSEDALKQARSVAMQRAAEMDALLQAVPAAVWIAHDPECLSVTGNRTADAWLRLSSGAQASLTAPEGERPTHFHLFQDGRLLRGEELPVQRAARGAVVRDYELEIRLSDGSARFALGNAAPLFDELGRPRGAVAAFVDITARKQAEGALRRQVAVNQHYLDTVQTLIVALDTEGRVTMINRKGCETLGYARDEILGLNWFATCLPQPEGMDRVYPVFRQIMAGELDAVEYYENPVRCRDGRLRLVAWHNASLIDAAGAITGALSSGEDITERKQAEDALRESRERLALALEAAEAGHWDWELDTGRATCDSDCYGLWGVEQGRERLDEWLEVVHPEDRERVRRAWLDAAGSGAALRLEFRVEHPDRGPRWLMLVGRTIRDEAGRPTRMSGLSFDITGRKQAEEALREADRRKDEFLALLAHELRNPLAPILNAVEILKLKGAPDPTFRKAQDLIERQLGHMVRLIEDLMDVARITTGKLQLRREPVDLATLLEQTAETMQSQVARAGQRLHLSLPMAPVHVDADPVRLGQVFLNLLDNACKYTGTGGVISLSAERDGDDVEIRVEDTGIGIPPEDLTRLFQMFARAGAPGGHAQSGLGIGLALARGLVEMHGGRIEARSEGLGRGSSLIVRLPVLAAPTTTQSTQPKGSGASDPVVPLRILVADDNRDVVESLALLLELTGHRVERAYDGLEAVEAAERYRPDLVLLDIGMPKLDGYEACRRIRGQPWGRHMLIVALTGWGQEDDRRRSKAAGFDRHLVKPVAPADLLRLLAERRGGRR
ncbi:MAG: PAS domain S-box protein [Bdellovibrio bacteriovorus]